MGRFEINCQTHRPVPGFSPYSVDGPRPHVIFPAVTDTEPAEQVGNFLVFRPVVQKGGKSNELNRRIDPNIIIRVRESKPDNLMGGGDTLGGGYVLKTWEEIPNNQSGLSEKPKIHHDHLTLFPKLDPDIHSQMGEMLNGSLDSANGILDFLPPNLKMNDDDIRQMVEQGSTQLTEFLSRSHLKTLTVLLF